MKKLSFFSLSIFITALCACISCGYFLSSVVLSSSLFQNTSVVTTPSEKIFAISMMASEDKSALLPCVESLQEIGGAGYILEKNDKFHLIASVYESINDAELVKNNLKLNSVEAEILTIEKDKTTIEGNFNSEEKEILQESLKCELEVFKKLYDVAISLDTAVLDKNKAKIECNNIYSSFISTKTNFESFFKEETLTNDMLMLKTELEKTNDALSILANEQYSTTSQTYSSLIKQTYCKILFE